MKHSRHFFAAIFAVLSCASAFPVPPSDVNQARDILKRPLRAPSSTEAHHSSWVVRISALKRSQPDRAGVALATQYLSDAALVVRLQAVQWLSAYAKLQKYSPQALPLATLQALTAQLKDSRNFKSNGEPLWVPGPSLQLLTQSIRQMETKKAREWSNVLHSLALKTHSRAWREQLTKNSSALRR